MADELIGRVFPAGGPVEPAFIIGREGDIADVCARVRNGLHTMIAGARRIGKTTVANAACARLRDGEHLVVDVEVPERSTPDDLCQFIIERCQTQSRSAKAGRAAEVVLPLIEKLLTDEGLPLNLSALQSDDPTSAQQRAVLALPKHLARELAKPVVFFLDELQRVADYADGERFLIDLVDLYAGQTAVILLIDGSSERTLARLYEEPVSLGKLAERLDLAPTIPFDQWRRPIREHFARTGLTIDDDAREAILEFGAERPYETMTAARHAAFMARRLETEAVTLYVARAGLEAAKAALDDD